MGNDSETNRQRKSISTGRWFVILFFSAVVVISIVNRFQKIPIVFPETANLGIVALSAVLFFIPLLLIGAVITALVCWFRARKRFQNREPEKTLDAGLDFETESNSEPGAPKLWGYVFRALGIVVGLLWVLAGIVAFSIGSMAFGSFFLWALAVFLSADMVFIVLTRIVRGAASGGFKVRLIFSLISVIPFVVFALITGLFKGRMTLIIPLALAVPFCMAGSGPLSAASGIPRSRANKTAWRSMMWAVLIFDLVSVTGFLNLKVEYLPSCDKIGENPYISRLSDIGKPYDLLIDPNGKYLYATTGVLHKVLRIDLSDPGNVKQIDTGVKTRPERMVMDPKRGEIYIENSQENSPVSVITIRADTFESDPTRFVMDTLRRTPVWLDLDPKRDNLIVTYEKLNGAMVSTYSLENMTENNRKTMGWAVKDPYSGIYSPSADRIYMDEWIQGRLLVEFDPGTLKVLKTIYIGPMNFGMAMDESRGRLYIARFLNSAIGVIRVADLEKVDDFPAGFGVRDIAVDQARNLLYASNFCDGTLDVIDVFNGSRLHRLKIGIASRDVEYDSATDRLFAASECGIFEIKIKELLKQL